MENKKDYYKHLKWFNIYCSLILPVFTFISVIAMILQYFQEKDDIINDYIYWGSFWIVFFFDFTYCFLSIKTTIVLFNKDSKSVTYLIFLLFYNWLYKACGSTIRDIGSFNIGAYIIYLLIFALYYIPNIIYFVNRINVFNNSKLTSDNSNNYEKNSTLNQTKLSKIEEKEKLYCTKCGKEINIEWDFCRYCGNKLK